MLNLGKGISEYEDRTAIPMLWEEPLKYDEIYDHDYYIVSGRKGSGKSTIVDYKEITASDGELIIVIRPTENQELYERIREISEGSKLEYSDLRQALAKLFEFITYVTVMRRLIHGKENHYTSGNLSIIYTFLAQNKLIDGSIIKKALDHMASVTDEFKNLNRVFSLLQKVKPPTFQAARDAVLANLKKEKRRISVFFDDIDGYGFEYNKNNKAFLDALVINAMNVNTLCARTGANLRTVVTPPTELFDNAKFWNRDKILGKTTFLRWNSVQKLQNLVNRRIAAELKIRRRKQRYPGDIFSIDPAKTWEKIFPKSLYNRIGTQENTIDYIVRHTFYTPRNVLSICQKILEKLAELGYSIETLAKITEREWTNAIQQVCEEESNESAKNVVDIYTTIYPGIENVLELFDGRPNLWNAKLFRTFLRTHAQNLVRFGETDESLTSENIIAILYSMGFLGYAFTSSVAPHLARHYDLVFSYLKWTTRASWDLAVFSPVFYDWLRVKPITEVVVRPHSTLKMAWNTADQLARYDPRTNAF